MGFRKDSLRESSTYIIENDCEGVNGHMKVHYVLESRLHVVRTGAIIRHVLWTLTITQAIPMVRLQYEVIGNLLTQIYIQ